jgi:hypothetical protein
MAASVKVPKTETVAGDAASKSELFLIEIHKCCGISATIKGFHSAGGADTNAIRVTYVRTA